MGWELKNTIRTWWKSHSSRTSRQAISSHGQTGSVKWWSLAFSLISDFLYRPVSQSREWWCPQWMGLPTSINTTETVACRNAQTPVFWVITDLKQTVGIKHHTLTCYVFWVPSCNPVVLRRTGIFQHGLDTGPLVGHFMLCSSFLTKFLKDSLKGWLMGRSREIKQNKTENYDRARPQDRQKSWFIWWSIWPDLESAKRQAAGSSVKDSVDQNIRGGTQPKYGCHCLVVTQIRKYRKTKRSLLFACLPSLSLANSCIL